MANKKIKIAGKEATFDTIQVVEKYKKLDDFENDAILVGADAYLIGFVICRDKVTQPTWLST